MSFHTRIKPVAIAVITTFGAAGLTHAADATLPQVNVQDQTERADGPVAGYCATRSATFTKTDTPLKEVPASVSVVPAELMKDQAMQNLADVIRYVPGPPPTRAKATVTSSSCAASAPRLISTSTAFAMTRRYFATSTTSSASKCSRAQAA